jgi:predicted dehydrogenase
MLRMLLGEPSRVSASAARLAPHLPPYDTLHALLHFEHCASAAWPLWVPRPPAQGSSLAAQR